MEKRIITGLFLAFIMLNASSIHAQSTSRLDQVSADVETYFDHYMIITTNNLFKRIHFFIYKYKVHP